MYEALQGADRPHRTTCRTTGPRVRAIDPHPFRLSEDAEGGTWCLRRCLDGVRRTRLVSRWRIDWPLTPATVFWILLSDPGSFVTERRMLLGIRKRAERFHGSVLSGRSTADP